MVTNCKRPRNVELIYEALANSNENYDNTVKTIKTDIKRLWLMYWSERNIKLRDLCSFLGSRLLQLY